MPDESSNEQPSRDNLEPSASAIFAAMMRQVAAKAGARAADAAANAGQRAPLSLDAEAEAEPPITRETRIETRRIRRAPYRLALRRPHPSSMASGFLGTVFVVVVTTALVATLLMFFVNPEYLNPAVVQGLEVDPENILADIAAPAPTAAVTPQWLQRIGIISGHRGKDSGAVCEDDYGNPELLEVDINFAVSQRIIAHLRAENYAIDMLDENDPRLENYRAAAVVSIHANTCADFGEFVSGYIVHKSDARPENGSDAFLRECIAINYGARVPLPRSYTETEDLINYHAFQRIHPLTPAVILEMGYMLADREILTEDPDLLANAVTAGILCYIDNAALPPGQQSGGRGGQYLVPARATPTPIFGG